MKIKSLLMAVVAVSFVFAACDENLPDKLEPELKAFPALEDYPIEAWVDLAQGSDVGVTIEVTSVDDRNFVFELRPGAMVQSYKMDVYPLAQLYNYLLNDKNSGNLELKDAVGINERIRSYLFTEGSGGYAFSINDYENPEEFLQVEYDWMSTPYAAASAVAIPDCGFVIAVVASADPDISSSNQEELTLCYVHTESQPLAGDPQVEIEVSTGYRAFAVEHHPNADAAGVYYYFGGLASEIDEYIDSFGDTMFRDFMRTLYSEPVASDNTDGLGYTKNYGEEADHNIKSATCAVAVDVNLTPQEGYSRQDFSLEEMPDEEEQELAEPQIRLIPERISSTYLEFEVTIPKTCNTVFYSFYSKEEKEELESSSLSKKKEAVRLVHEGYGFHNPNFAWNKDAPEGEEATGSSAVVTLDAGGFAPGQTLYIGMTGRNGYLTAGPLVFSEPITFDERNYTSPDGCKVTDLALVLDNPTRTSFRENITYNPENVSTVYTQWIPAMIPEDPMDPESEVKPWQEVFGLTVESPWEEWVDLIFNVTGDMAVHAASLQTNEWPVNESGKDVWTWTGMDPGVEYTVFLVAEDFDGNLSQVLFDSIVTKEVQVGPDPTVNMTFESTDKGSRVVYTVDHDVEYFKYCLTDNVASLNIPGATQGSLKDIAGSGIPYETWSDKIYEWAMEVGMDTNYETVSQDAADKGMYVAACIAVGRKADGTPAYKMSHLIIRDGVAETLEEIFGIDE